MAAPVPSAGAPPAGASLRALDALNVTLPEIAGGIGPFLVVWLSVALHWPPERIGLLMGLAGAVSVVAQGPAGALVDGVAAKRGLVVGGSVVIAVACLAMLASPGFGGILAAQSAIALAGAVLVPSVAAISLGLVGRAAFDRRMGRNASLAAAGNVVMALSLGLLGRHVGYGAMFVFVAGMAAATALCCLAIDGRRIDARLARGADGDAPADGQAGGPPTARNLAVLLERRLLTLAVCAVGFHFANAALLTLVGQRFGEADAARAPQWMSYAVAITQLVIVPLGVLTGRFAHRLPRKPVFLVAFAVLPVRCLLYTLSADPRWLLALQLLDGIGAGIFGVMLVLMVADLTRGSGRFNLAQGALGTAVGLGAALSNVVAGYLVRHAGYNGAFVAMAVIAVAAGACFLLAMPETKPRTQASPALGRKLAA